MILYVIGIDVADQVVGEPLRLATLRSTTGLKLTDCCALETAMATGSVLATFDDALAAAARDRHLGVAPVATSGSATDQST